MLVKQFRNLYRSLNVFKLGLHDCSLQKVALILNNAIFDAITAAPLTKIDLHWCEKLAKRWVNTDDVGPLLNQHWDKIG